MNSIVNTVLKSLRIMSLTENVSVLMSRRMERAAGTPLGTPIPILECSEQSSQSLYKVFKLSKRTILIFLLPNFNFCFTSNIGRLFEIIDVMKLK